MGWLRNLLSNSVSPAAIAAVDLARREVELHASQTYGQRPTPRKPERRKALPVASPRRAKHRREMRAIYERNLRREREIGIDPIYWNAAESRIGDLAELREYYDDRRRAWDKANPLVLANG